MPRSKTKVAANFATFEAKLATAIAGLETKIAEAQTSTAKWIITAVILNSLTVLGGIAAIWQIANK